ncbi:unnamed protein product [Symbiodinium necroappetens]|uniref:C2H2-type domain-containing protein n=1 Tax=Symbiodinium necroappetens TaxID=1628268 RepID=A0A813AK30_9DINO|nr:unnamed protein product [Symbiodinium necroappetens]
MLLRGIMPETMEISDAAKSGDGTTTNVGIKMTGTFQCPECRQKFDSEKAKQLHWKFIHDPNRLLHASASCLWFISRITHLTMYLSLRTATDMSCQYVGHQLACCRHQED